MEEKKIINIYGTLTIIARELNNLNVTWGIGGSLLLYRYGLVNNVNDIDILIDYEDRFKVKDAFSKYGITITNKNIMYRSDFFLPIRINNVNVDVIGNFKVFNKQMYEYKFDKSELSMFIYNNEKIFYCSISKWKEAYKVLNRLDKYNKIKEYLEDDRYEK